MGQHSELEERQEKFYFRDPAAPKPNVALSPGVAAVIFDEHRRILLLKRAKGPYWSLPGGRMDVGESAAGCCIRETREETGLETEVVRIIGVYSDPTSIVAYPDGNVQQSFVVLFEARVVGGEFTGCEEAEELYWISREELDSFAVIPDSVLGCEDAWAGVEAALIR